MRRLAYALVLSALALVAVTVVVLGGVALVFPFCMLLSFFILFVSMASEAYFTVQRTPGVERLPEPDLVSMIYNTWLFKTNVKAWAKYASTLSLLVSVSFGSLFGVFILLGLYETGIVAYVSWFAGLFLTGAIAFGVGTSEHWAEKTEAAAAREEQLHRPIGAQQNC